MHFVSSFFLVYTLEILLIHVLGCRLGNFEIDLWPLPDDVPIVISGMRDT